MADPNPTRPSPKRVQMSRQSPWRAEHPDAVIVARPSKWGNPFRIGDPYMWLTAAEEGALDWPIPTYREPGTYDHGIRVETCADAATAVKWYRAYLHSLLHTAKHPLDIAELAGRDLACWCPLEDAQGNRLPCHADVLLEIANSTQAGDA